MVAVPAHGELAPLFLMAAIHVIIVLLNYVTNQSPHTQKLSAQVHLTYRLFYSGRCSYTYGHHIVLFDICHLRNALYYVNSGRD